MNVFLDNASTTPLLPEVKEYIISLLDCYGNPSSIHSKGVESKKIINKARKNVANFINANDDSIIFTPSGSASNVIAISSLCELGIRESRMFFIPTAHKSILEYCTGYGAEPMEVFGDGIINIEEIESKFKYLQRRRITPVVICEYANSEIGTIQPIQKIIEITHKYNGLIHVDCTGSISTIPLDVKSLNADTVAFSGHKIGALKGIGVIWYNPVTVTLTPLIKGSQESGIVGGTENFLGIASLGAATEYYKYNEKVCDKRDYVLNWIIKNISNTYLVGAPTDKRLSGNLNICFKYTPGGVLTEMLNEMNIQVSTGSACNSGNEKPSATLKAIHIPNEDVHCCLRMTFSGEETKEELDYVCKYLKICVDRIRRNL